MKRRGSSGGGGGGNKANCITKTPSSSIGTSNREEFARSVAKMAVAQICESVGLHSFQASAIETLADIAIRYLKDLAKAAHHYTNMAGRIETNAFDLILAMEDLGTSGSSAADRNRPLSSSNAIREVMRFVEYSSELPFCKPLPRFPAAKKRPAAPSFAQLSETPPGSHIPSWLPALPDPHTYRSTPVWPDHKRDAAATRLEQAKQRRKAESSLVSLHSKLSSAATKEQSDLIAKLEAEGRPVASEDAFFKVLPAGSKEVSPPPLPAPPRVVVEAFAPVLASAEKSGLEVEEGIGIGNDQQQQQQQLEKGAILDFKDRPKVIFHFEFNSRVRDQAAKAPVVLGTPKLPAANVEEEKDEKRRRVEQLLSQEPLCSR